MISSPRQKKVLLMGKGGSGKTSMRSIIFANYQARDTRRLRPTLGAEQSYVRFLNMVLNLWDCGGQGAYLGKYFTASENNIFKDVEVLIYVFDVECREDVTDMKYYELCLDSLAQFAPKARLFCLVHKMDLIPPEQRETIFRLKEKELIDKTAPRSCVCFPTSIWDESLYKAWSRIVYMLIPNIESIERKLYRLAGILEADEILLFEKATFLIISHRIVKPHRDNHRFEKISNIIKQFKLSCSKLATSFDNMEIRNDRFIAFMESFTANTYVMVIGCDPKAGGVMQLNILNAKRYFSNMEP
ncbi:hypothetical protein GJ496_001402 [Pomphorhynchus laevis]|nr:hypothetical protein GJ496_001402 [Pomphorhynchus laevis]